MGHSCWWGTKHSSSHSGKIWLPISSSYMAFKMWHLNRRFITELWIWAYLDHWKVPVSCSCNNFTLVGKRELNNLPVKCHTLCEEGLTIYCKTHGGKQKLGTLTKSTVAVVTNKDRSLLQKVECSDKSWHVSVTYNRWFTQLGQHVLLYSRSGIWLLADCNWEDVQREVDCRCHLSVGDPFHLSAPNAHKFSGLIPNKCLNYINDILVLSATFKEHLENMRDVLTDLHSAWLKLTTTKCHLAREELHT